MAEVSVAGVRDGGRKAEMDGGTELRLLGGGAAEGADGCAGRPEYDLAKLGRRRRHPYSALRGWPLSVSFLCVRDWGLGLGHWGCRL